ncbi:MAG: hypothetical protein K2Q18_04160 [Bdellovibrionales bacterium]|nr:hypothetical protein [Bdellovibrionales bacterium]
MNILRKLHIVGLTLGLTILSQTASAGLLLEPHVAYNLSGSGTESGTEYDYNGAQIGARVGYQNWGFMTGLDYTKGSGSVDSKTAGVTTTRDLSSDEIGIFAGYNLPILFRAWGAYYFSNETTYKGGFDLSGDTKELGVGFTGLPFLSINLVYRMVNFDESKNLTTSVKSSVSYDFNEIVLGVSLPFNL